MVFIDDIKDVNLPAIGPKLENHPLFPERTNIEFVEVLSHNKHKPLQEKQIQLILTQLSEIKENSSDKKIEKILNEVQKELSYIV